jgi:hypothetical protein
MVIVTDDILNEEPKPETVETTVERDVTIGNHYKDANGNVFKVVTIARDYSTQEELIIYKAEFGSTETWAMPKTIFLSDVEGKPRFIEVE